MIDVNDLADHYRSVLGLPPHFSSSGLSEFKAFSYQVILEDESKTTKDIETNRVYRVGDRILDTETGIYGTITRVEPIFQRLQR